MFDADVGLFIRDISDGELYPLDIPINKLLLDVVWKSHLSTEGDIIIQTISRDILLINVDEKRVKCIFDLQDFPESFKVDTIYFRPQDDTIIFTYSESRGVYLNHFFDYSGRPHRFTAVTERIITLEYSERFRKLLYTDLYNTLYIATGQGYVLGRFQNPHRGRIWELGSPGIEDGHGNNPNAPTILWRQDRFLKGPDDKIVHDESFGRVQAPQLRFFLWARIFYILHQQYDIPLNILNGILLRFIRSQWK